MPSPLYFPLEKLSAAVPDAEVFTTPNSHKSTSTITVPKFPEDIPINLATLLQYGSVTGLPALSILPFPEFLVKIAISTLTSED